MTPQTFLRFLDRMEAMKCNTRHSWTSDGTHETVAAHSWRLALMAMMAAPELPEVDMNKVLKMCVLHDIGEAVTGDIPSFEKTEANSHTERRAVDGLLARLGEPLYAQWTALFDEMEARQTIEAKVFKALDRMEAVIQHNEADLATWLPLEYELQMTYGVEDAQCHPFLSALRQQVMEDTQIKTKTLLGADSSEKAP